MEYTRTEKEEREKNYRISNATGAGMLCVAGVYDLLSLIPIVTYIVIPVAWLHFWMWFGAHDVNIGFANPKKLLTMGGISIIEAIPALGNISPTWILGIGFQLLTIRVEDKTGVSVTSIGGLTKGLAKDKKGSVKKMIKRAQQPPEKQREAVRRLNRIRDIKESRGTQPVGRKEKIRR